MIISTVSDYKYINSTVIDVLITFPLKAPVLDHFILFSKARPAALTSHRTCPRHAVGSYQKE
jgi:hypothetical protein